MKCFIKRAHYCFLLMLISLYTNTSNYAEEVNDIGIINKYYTSVSNAAELRKEPSDKSGIVRRTELNEKLLFLNEYNNFDDCWPGKWYYVQTNSLDRYWIHSCDIFAKKKICKYYFAKKYIIGEWNFGGGQAYNSSFKFNSDGKFVFNGLFDPNFTSTGKWDFDEKNLLLKIQFQDQRNHWKKSGFFIMDKKVFLEYKKRDKLYSIDSNSMSVIFELEEYSISFMGWIFYKRCSNTE